MNRLAIIAQDQATRETLTSWVEDLGHRACPYSNGLLAEQALRRQPITLVVAELSSRGVDGIALAKSVRAFSEIPILLVSRTLDEVEQVLSLKAGADQTLRWPASRSVTTATIEAMLHRFDRLSRPRDLDTRTVEAGHLTLDAEYHVARWKDRDVKLTANEFAILRRLANRPGTVKSRDQLMGTETAQPLPERTIDSHIKRIRKKLRAVDPEFDHIETMYGLGYRYLVEDRPEAATPISAAKGFRTSRVA